MPPDSLSKRPESPPAGPTSFFRDVSGGNVLNAIVGFIFIASGPVAVLLAVGADGGLDNDQLASWIFGSFGLNGLLSIAFCLYFRQPLVLLWTIPGAVLVAPALGHLSFAEVIGAYYATGLLILVLGLTGLVRRAMDAVPMPIVMAMVAGVFLRFGLDWVHAFDGGFWIAAPMTAAFLLASAIPVIALRIPPLIAALVAGAAVIAVVGDFSPARPLTIEFSHPTIYLPAFSLQAMIELVVPLAITVLAVQNSQGIAILRENGHLPPVNGVTVGCGVGSLASASVGAVSTCLVGPLTAILSGSGPRERQYTAGVLIGVFAVLFGVMAPTFVNLMLATPKAFLATLAGIAMLRVLQQAFVIAFRGPLSLGPLVTFIITISEVSVFNIGAPFWGLIVGYLVSRILEPDHFAAPEDDRD